MASFADVDLPKMADGFLGEQPKFAEYGLKTYSHHEPVIILDGNEGEVTVERTQTLRIMGKLVPYGTQKECADHCLMRVDPSGTLVSFSFICPGTGWFKLHVYGLPPSEAGPKLLGVYNYIIMSKSITKEGHPFPKQYGQWRDDGCYLYEPLVLHAGKREAGVHFKVRIPGAGKVAIKADNDWEMLEHSGERDVWEGDVNLSGNYPPNTKVKLNCNYTGSNFNTLLEWTI